jgi:PhzF family phenazine biosynthesis protein
MGYRLAQVDAFSDQPFSGNPAAVCILTKPVSDSWMHNLAMEMNLSATAFLLEEEEGYNLRWFTPAREVELCGHATLAAAHTLWDLGYLKPHQEAHFSTLSGTLNAQFRESWIELDFPAEPEQRSTHPKELVEGLGVPVAYVGKNRFDYLVAIESEEVLRGIKPDFSILTKLQARGVVVTARSSNREFDFVSRWFGPQVGINEDQVTGSAHCCLALYWADILKKAELVAYQASQRGGVVRMRLKGDRVFLSGQAVTIFTGEVAETAFSEPNLSLV